MTGVQTCALPICLDKTRMEHTYAAVALNLIRLGAWWNGHPLDRTRTSHLACLELELAS